MVQFYLQSALSLPYICPFSHDDRDNVMSSHRVLIRTHVSSGCTLSDQESSSGPPPSLNGGIHYLHNNYTVNIYDVNS